jgi:hypothetical protein
MLVFTYFQYALKELLLAQEIYLCIPVFYCAWAGGGGCMKGHSYWPC